ncbi:hypothetical protein BBOV_III010015 [Babesia bovis T2Bo]|uniref:hypothetical protein n=1 Tax=Babesia bovis T2Bo TaxID=484906 RepID=UPI001C365CE1|nr:hypothetical protein BBOV_III010015 [Babesia bovis T2Bo]KAG6440047.1 hypothetical protein BBOV_III010015 [Babesia bovis T2Bo]
MKIVTHEDEIDKLENEVRRRLAIVSGLLKLRNVQNAEIYVEHFKKAKLQFDEIAQYIAEVQQKVDHELALLHQVDGVVQAHELQQKVIKEVEKQIQTSEAIKAISELRHSATVTKNEMLQKTGNKDTHSYNKGVNSFNVHTANKNNYAVRAKVCNNVPGSYSKNRDTFNKYIL